MKPCTHFEDVLWELPEGDAEVAALAAHLAACASCRLRRESLASVQEGLALLRTVTAPDPRAALRTRRANRARRRRYALSLTAAALALGAALFLVARAPQHPSQLPPGSTPPRVATKSPSKEQPLVALPVRERLDPAPRPIKLVADSPRVKTTPRGESVVTRLPSPPKPWRRQVASSLNEPCPQVTVFVPRPADRPEPPPYSLDPTYRALPQPVLITTSNESHERFPSLGL